MLRSIRAVPWAPLCSTQLCGLLSYSLALVSIDRSLFDAQPRHARTPLGLAASNIVSCLLIDWNLPALLCRCCHGRSFGVSWRFTFPLHPLRVCEQCHYGRCCCFIRTTSPPRPCDAMQWCCVVVSNSREKKIEAKNLQLYFVCV